MKIKIHLIKLLLLAVTMFALPKSAWADGSKDLYPSGVSGHRAFLRSGTSASLTIGAGDAYPFANRGTHYVYAKVGEVIMLASSAQGFGTNATTRYNNRNNIQLYGPNGAQITLNVGATSSGTGNNVLGNIGSRTQELAGPSVTGGGTLGTTGNYKPIEYIVPEGGEGVYLVHFLALGANDPNGTSVLANNNWTQASTNSNIAAWDVSVRNGSILIPGRVYFNTIGLSTGNYGNGHQNEYFNGIFYALTKDGYYYRIKSNGMNGVFWQFYVNNYGFVDADQNPLYKSLNSNNPTDPQIPDPNVPDDKVITHKLFYYQPNKDLPETATGARYNNTAPRAYTVGSSTVWLKKETQNSAQITDLKVTGNEGSSGIVGIKGGKISFTSATSGSYSITIVSSSNTLITRTLTGNMVEGQNTVDWDGKTIDDQLFPEGLYILDMYATGKFGEVHFPFLDVEYNKNGIVIEQVEPIANNNTWDVLSSTVYWDDGNIPIVSYGPNPRINLMGESSVNNGHKWRVNGSNINNQYGNARAIDTWTYVTSEMITLTTTFAIKNADLKVESVTPDKNTIYQNDEVTYTVKVKNGGPSDVEGSTFTFKVPEGFDPVNIVFTGNDCGEETIELVYDAATRTYTSELKLPNQCVITYEITVKATHPTPGDAEVVAAILRPNDVTDPDATNPDPAVPPTDAHYECNNNGSGGVCNNIKTITITVSEAEPEQTIAKSDINQIPQGETATGNVLTNDEGEGLTVQSATYTDASGNTVNLPLGTPTEIYSEDPNNPGAYVKSGTMTLHPDGSYTFIPTSTFTGKVPVNYTAVDENGNTDTTSLTIEVIPAVNPSQNSDPIAQNDTGMTKKGVSTSGNVLSNDSDPDGNTLTVTGASQGGTPIVIGTPTQVSGIDKDGNPVANAGTLTLNTDGSYTFVPAVDFVGEINPITYTISDGNGGTDTAELFITVLEDKGNTTFANDDANVAPKGETMTGNTLVNDFDPEGNPQTLTSVTIDGTDYPIGPDTEIVISGKGTLTMHPDGSYTFVPEDDFVGTVVVEQTVCDDATPEAACDQATLYLTNVDLLLCYKPGKFDTNGGLPTKVGISSLRMTESTEWPSARQGAWIALEAKTKGFVPNRLSATQIAAIPAASLVKGMMVYNSTEDCLQINVDGTATGWNCFNVQTCD